MKTVLISCLAVLSLAACGGHESGSDVNQRIAKSLELGDLADNVSSDERAFVAALSHSDMSRPWWVSASAAFNTAHATCDVTNAAVWLASDEGGGWDYADAEIFVEAANAHLCRS